MAIARVYVIIYGGYTLTYFNNETTFNVSTYGTAEELIQTDVYAEINKME